MTSRRPGDKALSEPMMVTILTHICVSLPGFTLIPVWISYHISNKVRDESIHPFTNINSCTTDILELIINFIPLFMIDVANYPCWACKSMLIKEAPVVNMQFGGLFPQFTPQYASTVYPKKYAHGFVVLCFVVVTQSFIMNSHEVIIHIHQGCFAGTGAIVRLPQCQWSKPDGYGKISQCITTTKHSKAKTMCIFLGIYCISTRPFAMAHRQLLLTH